MEIVKIKQLHRNQLLQKRLSLEEIQTFPRFKEAGLSMCVLYLTIGRLKLNVGPQRLRVTFATQTPWRRLCPLCGERLFAIFSLQPQRTEHIGARALAVDKFNAGFCVVTETSALMISCATQSMTLVIYPRILNHERGHPE